MVEGVERVRAYFDEIGDSESDRMIASPRDRVSFELHRRMLAEHVRAGDRVLEIGAGPGRFTIELAQLGVRVVVTDISSVQLELNERHVREHGCEGAVERRLQLDVRDVGDLGPGEFDAVVAFGGPISYVFEDAEKAFRALVNVTKPGGMLLGSVMSAVGAFRYFLPLALEEADRFGTAVYDHVLSTGDLRAIPNAHTCRMYRWSELRNVAPGVPGRFVAASASNWMSLADADVVAAIEADADRWTWFLDWEAKMCREPGALDGGTHILFAFRRDPDPDPSLWGRLTGRDKGHWRAVR